MAGLDADDIELIVYGSAHQDQMPTASTRIQEMLGISECAEISVHANCTSAYKALAIAHDMIGTAGSAMHWSSHPPCHHQNSSQNITTSRW